MVTNVSSKSELRSLASKLVSQSTQLKSVSDGLKSVLNGIPNYEDIDVSSAGNVLASNLVNITADMDVISNAIQGYITELEAFDVYDLNVEAELSANKAGNTPVNKNPVNKNPVTSTPVTSAPVTSTPTVPSTPSPGVGSNGSPMTNVEVDKNEDVPVVEQSSNNGRPSNSSGSTINNGNGNNISMEGRPVINERPSDLGNSNSSNENNNSSIFDNGQYVDNDKQNNLENVTTNNNVSSSIVDRPSNNVSSNIGNVGSVTNNNSLSSTVEDMPVIDNVVVDETVSGDMSNIDFSEDIYVNDDSGYIGQTNSDFSNSIDNNDDGGSVLPGILGGLGAAAVIGGGAVVGAKVIKNMKENQEIDDEDE